MGSWWSDLERVSTVNNWVLGFAAILGFLAAVLVVAGWFIGARASDLEKRRLSEFQSDANTRIATANQIAAQANEHAKQLEAQAEELKNQNLEIQRRISPRFLTIAEQQTILVGISPFRGHQIIIDRLGDGEAGPYADSIIGVFRKAGWAVQINSIGVYSPPTYGIVCTASASPDEGTRELIDAFKKAQINLVLKTLPAASHESWVEMFVGLKPIN